MKDWASESKEEKDRYEETAWWLGNILNSGADSQRRYLLNEKVFEAFCAPLRNPASLEPKSKQVLLEGLYRLLSFSEVDFAGSMEVVFSLLRRRSYMIFSW